MELAGALELGRRAHRDRIGRARLRHEEQQTQDHQSDRTTWIQVHAVPPRCRFRYSGADSAVKVRARRRKMVARQERRMFFIWHEKRATALLATPSTGVPPGPPPLTMANPGHTHDRSLKKRLTYG